MKTIRSFIAIPLAPEILRKADRLVQRVREKDDGIRWVPNDSLHLTLKFLGEVENTEVHRVCEVIQNVSCQYEPFELQFLGTGGFPNLQRPRVLYAGVQDATGSLTEIVARLEKELAKLGFKPEPRDYRPHLTLGRTKSGSRLAGSDVIGRLESENDTLLGEMVVDSVQLIGSFLDQASPTYQVMDTVELGS